MAKKAGTQSCKHRRRGEALHFDVQWSLSSDIHTELCGRAWRKAFAQRD